jgi:prepilin-type N-terminal cleavage/methylation domain-containing protein
MKDTRYSQRAFTLIELLTVIAIIAILAALVFPAIKSSMTKAEVTRAHTAVRSLETAFKTYYNEYGRLPATTTDPHGIMYTTNGLVALLDLVINPSINSTNFVDPWKRQYEFLVDTSYSNLSTNPFNNTPTITFEHADFLIWSAGPDGQELGYWQPGAQNGQGANKDNVVSW